MGFLQRLRISNVQLLILMQLMLFTAGSTAVNVPACSASDRKALLQFKSAFSADPRKSKQALKNWSGSKSCCSWEGITCNTNGRVIGLELKPQSIFVQNPQLFASSLSNLTELEVISFEELLHSESVLLPLPTELKSLQKLTTISITVSNVGGSIPSEWSQITSLQILNLSSNPTLTGSIPTSLCNLKNLKIFSIMNDPSAALGSVSGTIPACFGSLSQLTSLELSNNRITGNIPTELGRLTNLVTLRLSNNLLKGNIPSSIGNLQQLTVLELEGNSFSGKLPESLKSLTKLQELRLGAGEFTSGRLKGFNKELSGTLPLANGGGTSLKVLRIRGTSIGGTLPATIGVNLVDVSLDNNEFSGNIPASLGLAKNLTNINLAGNHFEGQIPTSFSSLSLITLNLSNNQLTGSIPTNLGHSLQFLTLDLHNNKLTGQFPTSLWQVRSIILSQNQMTSLPEGDIPSDTGTLMQDLYLDSNEFTGTIPLWTFRASSLLNLANNRFVSFPSIQDPNIVSMDYLNISRNLLTGSIPEVLGNVKSLNDIDLSYNKLTGEIPNSFTSTSGFLNNLVLSHNQLSGHLPDTIFYSPWFNTIDLSHNSLSGPIPATFPNETSFMYSVDLSFNLLSGSVPTQLFTLSGFMQRVKLSHNQFTGPIPNLSQACKTTHLNTVALDNNNFTGNLQGASWIADCASSINVFDISDNSVSGPIPDLSSWTKLKVLNLARNKFTGSIPAALLGGLPDLQVLDVSGNKLKTVESWKNLRTWKALKNTSTVMDNNAQIEAMEKQKVYYQDDLVYYVDENSMLQFTLTITATTAMDFSGNAITGKLPSEMGSLLRGLRVLNLSHNGFSGALPGSTTGSFSSLRVLDVSYNAFSGKIPASLSSFSASDFAGNPALCGAPLSRGC